MRSLIKSPYALAACVVALVTTLTCLARSWFALLDVVMLFMLGILAVAVKLGRGPAVFAAALSVGAYNFFFIPPVFTFRVDDLHHLLTFAMMFVIGFSVSAITWHVDRQEHDVRAKDRRARMLERLGGDLGTFADELEASRGIAERAATLFQCAAAVVSSNAAGDLALLGQVGAIAWGDRELRAVHHALSRVEPAGLDSDAFADVGIASFPLEVGGATSVLVLAPRETRVVDRDLVEAFAYQAALALTRVRLAERARQAALRAQAEQVRASLLSAVSHDLRTPLAVITSAASALRARVEHVSAEQRAELAATIRDEAERLEGLVMNLLNVTVDESGALEIRRELVQLDGVLASVLARLKPELGDRTIRLELSDALPRLQVDRILLSQVFVNLFDNVAKYTPSESPLEVCARVSAGWVSVDVADHGPGLAPGAEEKLFERFYRGTHPRTPGSGLGLAICRSIVEAHGGTLSARNAEGGGAVFRVSLPIPSALPN